MQLKIEQLDAFRALEPRDEAGLWQALETLADHREDHLVLVWETRVEQGNICRLTVFTARDPGSTLLYAGVTRSGTVVVGRADEGDARPDMYALDDFDPLRDEIVSIAVTARLRVVGERLDLWVVARRSSSKTEGEPETLAYHAMVWVDTEGQPKLQPALDDRDAAAGASWPASPAGRLPAHLRAWNFSCAPGIDPFDPIQKDLRLGQQASVDAVAWAGHTLWFATAKSLQMTPFGSDGSDERHPYSEPLVERAIAIAPTNHPPWKARIIACGDNRTLFALTETEHGIKMPWYQDRDEFPMSVAFLAVGEGRGAQDEWPDIIVGSSNSRLERLRYVGSAGIQEVWNRCWRHLGLAEAEARIDAAGDLAGMAPPRSQALLVGAIDGVLEHAPKVSPERRQRWLKALSELFSHTPSKQVLSVGLSRLLRALRSFARSEMPIAPLPDYGGELLPGLVYNLYDRHLEAASRDRVDDIVRTANWSDLAQMDPNVQQLVERSKRSREDMRQDERPTEPFETTDPYSACLHRVGALGQRLAVRR